MKTPHPKCTRSSLFARWCAAVPLLLVLLFIARADLWAQPAFKWVRFTDAYGKDDYIEDVDIDSLGDIYVAGWITSPANDRDYFVAKYDPAGTREWYKVYNGGGDDQARTIAVKGSHVYVSGTSRSGSGLGADEDIVSFVLDTGGTLPMDSTTAIRYDFGGLHYIDQGIKIIPGADETFFVGGTHRDSLSSADHITVLEYGSSGLIHEASYSSGSSDEFVAMAVAGDSDVYVTGSTYVPATGALVYTTVKFDRDLQQKWVKTYSHAGYDEPLALFIDRSGIYVTGRSASSCGDLDAATVKYSPAGVQMWVARSFECVSQQVASGGITSDRDYIYVTAYHANGSELYKYDKSTGTMVLRPQSPIQSLWNTILVEHGTGNIYAAGHHLWYDEPSNGWHLAKFDAAGNLLSDILYDGSGVGNTNTMAKMLQSNYDSSLVMVGSTTVGTQQDIMIVKYGVGGTFLIDGVYQDNGQASVLALPQHFELAQNYPNPFNPATRIQFALREAGSVSLEIFDMLGRRVMSVLNGKTMSAGIHVVDIDAAALTSGVYIYRIMANGGRYTASKKMVIAR